MNLSLIQGYDRTTLKFMLEQDIPEETKVAIRAELQRRTIASSSQRIARADWLPPCMAPDGAGPCDVYHAKAAHIADLTSQLEAAHERERALRDALGHFAYQDNWESDDHGNYIWLAGDPMKVAQNALAAAQQEGAR